MSSIGKELLEILDSGDPGKRPISVVYDLYKWMYKYRKEISSELDKLKVSGD